MKAEIVRYSYETGSWDPCKGSRDWTETKMGMFVPDLNLFISPAHVGGGVSFHVLLGRFEDSQSLNFTPMDYDAEYLPKKDYEVLQTIELDPEIAEIMTVVAQVSKNLMEYERAKRILKWFLDSMRATSAKTEVVPF